MIGEIAHREIVGCIDGIHHNDTSLVRSVDQVLHEHRSESAALPFIADGYRALATESVGARAKTTDADFLRVQTLRDDRDERRLGRMVEVGELPQ